MYFVTYGSKYLHDPRVDGLVLTDLKFEGQENEASLCSFEISSFHPLYDELVERASTKFVEVFDDALGEDEPYFVGYIYEMSDEFDRQRTVKCKGELSFFNDSIVRPYTTQGSAEVDADPGAYFEWLVEEHNKQVEAAKQFSLGYVQASGLDLNGYILRADSTYPTTGEVVKNKLLESIGGVLNVRYEDGRRYIDYLSEWTDVNVQVFDFGVNLTDFAKTDDALDVATFVIPVGANMKDTDYDYDDGYFVTSDAAPVAKKEYFVRSFKKCGAMTAFADGVTYWEKKETDYFKTSDTKPFSGVDYYCKKFTKVNITKFATGKTYYRLIDGVYTKVTGAYNKNYTYYTMKWEKQSVSSFDSSKTYWEKETYYAKTSDSAPKSGKDYYLLKRGSYTSKSDLGRFLKYETYYEYSEANDESQRRLTIAGMADIQYDSDVVKQGDLVYSESAVEKYGWIGAVYENTDIKLRDNLLDAGVLALKEAVSPATTIEVKAVDLSLVNPEHKPIRVGEHVRVRCKPHGFDSYMLCTAVKLDLNNPENSEYTLGTTFDKLSGQQNKRIRALNKTIEQVYEQAASISEAAKAEALQAAEDAKKAQAEAVAANDSVLLAQENIDEAVTEAVEAKEQADAVQALAEVAKSAADEAAAQVTLIQADLTEVRQAADDAQAAADEAADKAQSAQDAADQAAQDAADANAAAGTAQSKADEAYAAAGQTQAKVDAIEGEIDSINEDAAQLRADLEGQIESVTNTMTADYAKKTELTETTATLRTEIETSAAGVRQTVEADYAKKTDLTSVQENLQTQVTQNAEAIEQKASKTEVADVQAGAEAAQAKADAAQEAADAADAAAKAAQAEAEQAKANAATSQSAADAAQAAADEAKANLAEAEEELASVKSRVGVTEQDIAAAEEAVAAAKKAADDAQADADAAASAASAAQSAADKAQADVNSLAARVTTAETAITQNSEAIALRATKTEVTQAVEGIEVGGRNLALGTAEKKTATGKGATNDLANLYERSSHTFDCFDGGPVSISFDWETTATSGVFRVQENNTPYESFYDQRVTVSESNQSGHVSGVSARFTPTSNGKTWAWWQLRMDDLVGDLTISNLKIEMGNKATDWTPAPEDMASKEEMNAAIELKADSITSTVSATYATQSSLAATNENVTSASAAAARAQATADSIVQLIISTDRSTTCRNASETVTATANVFRHGQRLTEEEVAELGTVRWYVNGLAVENVTGLTCTINACTATLKARLEAN